VKREESIYSSKHKVQTKNKQTNEQANKQRKPSKPNETLKEKKTQLNQISNPSDNSTTNVLIQPVWRKNLPKKCSFEAGKMTTIHRIVTS